MSARRIDVCACSIAETGADAVVNASNESATLGGGVSRALFNECGGPVLQAEMRQKLEDDFDGVLDAGDCMVTSGGTSGTIRHLLHVAAVDYRTPRARLIGSRAEKTVTSADRIQECTYAALRAAADVGSRTHESLSVGFPLLGAGAGGLPVAVSCSAMVRGIRAFFADWPDAPIGRIVFAVPEPDRLAVCSRLVAAAFG